MRYVRCCFVVLLCRCFCVGSRRRRFRWHCPQRSSSFVAPFRCFDESERDEFGEFENECFEPWYDDAPWTYSSFSSSSPRTALWVLLRAVAKSATERFRREGLDVCFKGLKGGVGGGGLKGRLKGTLKGLLRGVQGGVGGDRV